MLKEFYSKLFGLKNISQFRCRGGVDFKISNSNDCGNTLITGSTVFTSGLKNSVKISENCRFRNCRFSFYGSNNHLVVGCNCRFTGVEFYFEGNNNEIIIDDSSTSNERVQFAALSGTRLYVGKDCMFSHDIEIKTSDSHSICFIGENQPFNMPKDVIIEDHVWVGAFAKILKGVTVQHGSVIAEGAIVTKSISSNTIAAGIPAKEIKKNIEWKR